MKHILKKAHKNHVLKEVEGEPFFSTSFELSGSTKFSSDMVFTLFYQEEMDVRKKISKEIVDLFLQEGMVSFYTKVAEEFSLDVTEDSLFDCRKITVADNIMRQWFTQFEKEHGKLAGGNLSCYLCICGPKKNGELGEDEVEIQNGFIYTEKAGNKA